MTKPQLALLRQIANGNVKSTHDSYKPMLSLAKRGLIEATPSEFGQTSVKLTREGWRKLQLYGSQD